MVCVDLKRACLDMLLVDATQSRLLSLWQCKHKHAFKHSCALVVLLAKGRYCHYVGFPVNSKKSHFEKAKVT